MDECDNYIKAEIEWLNSVTVSSLQTNNKPSDEELLKIVTLKSKNDEFFNIVCSNTEPRCWWGYRASVYVAKNSEGNRFITNNEL